MRLLFRLSSMLLTVLFISCKSQQIKNISIKNARIIEANKKEFIGKPLSYLLSKIDKSTFKSVKYFPNKNKNDVSHITFRQVTYEDYLKIQWKEFKDKPAQLTIMLNQNFDGEGILCRPKENPKCAEWTKEDERNLGDLVVYDVYVLGKD